MGHLLRQGTLWSCVLLVAGSWLGGEPGAALIVTGSLGVLAAWHRRRRTWPPRDLASYNSLSSEEFEHAVASLLRALGWTRVQVVGGQYDNGADVLGVDPTGCRVVVQCKRWALGANVGTPELQTTLGAGVIHAADRVMVVTTARFSSHAVLLGRDQGIELIDGPALVELARRAGRLRARGRE